MLRAIAFIVSAIFLMPLASLPSLADEQGTKPQVAPTAPVKQDKQEMRSRGFQRSAPAATGSMPAAAPPASAPRGDGGGAEDTIGGLPGHSQGPGQDKQP